LKELKGMGEDGFGVHRQLEFVAGFSASADPLDKILIKTIPAVLTGRGAY